MRTLIPSLVILLLAVNSPVSAAEIWNIYQNLNDVKRMAFDGDYIWMTMGGGGVIRWNQKTGAYTQFNKSNGLMDNNTQEIFRDSSGKIWVPNGSGVSCFDGKTWKSLRQADGLEMSYVSSIAQDKNGIIWFGTSYRGAWSCDGVKLKHYTSDDCYCIGSGTSIALSKQGDIWLGTANGVVQINNLFRKVYPIGFVTSALADNNGIIWTGTSDGLLKFDGTKWTTVKGFNKNEMIHAMTIDSKGILWLSTEYNGYFLKKVENMQTALVDSGTYYSCLAVDSQGVLWGGGSGVIRFENGSETQYYTEQGFVHNKVNAVFIDSQEIKWFATEEGVSRYDGKEWKTIASYPSSAITADSTGTIWVGTKKNGLFKYDNEKLIRYNSYSQNITSIAFDNEGKIWNQTIWVADSTGVSYYDGNSWQAFSCVPFGFGNDNVTGIVTDENNLKWFATYENGIYIWDNTFSAHKEIKYLGVNVDDIVSFAAESNGKKWVVASGHQGRNIFTLEKFSSPAFEYYTLPDDVSGLKTVTIDSNDRKWFTSSQGGIYCLKDSTWTRYQTSDGLASNAINSIAVSPDGSVWASSTLGISQFDGKRWISYKIAENVPDNKINTIAVDNANRKWFGTSSGIYILDHEKFDFIPTGGVLTEGSVISIANSLDGSVWVCQSQVDTVIDHEDGHTGGGITRYYQGEWSLEITGGNSLFQSNYPYIIAIDRTGVPWAVYDKHRDGEFEDLSQVFTLENKNLKTITVENKFTRGIFSSLAIDKNNIKWFCFKGHLRTESEVFSTHDGIEFTTYPNPNLKCLISRGICEILWFISQNGNLLTRYDGYAWETFSPPYTFGGNGWSSYASIPIQVALDKNGITWFSTGQGLVRFDGKEWKLYPGYGDLNFARNITALASDHDGVLWIGTEQGIASLFEGEPTIADKSRERPGTLSITNAPNPFNPSTTISYTLPSSGRASLAI